MKPAWYEASTGNHQGLIVEEVTGRTVAVAYDKADAPLIAAAPDMLAALKALASTARTFRNVPKDEQEWTSLDDDALAAAFDAIAKACPQ